jgi:hypothetical protein
MEPRALARRSSASASTNVARPLQSAHVYRCRTCHANWADVVQLYDALLRPSLPAAASVGGAGLILLANRVAMVSVAIVSAASEVRYGPL